MLEGRRRELKIKLDGKMRDVRAESTRDRDVRGHDEDLEVDVGEDIDMALLQIQSQTLHAIDAALARLERGKYGTCLDCQLEISETRLHALPFAVRCRDCEEVRERTRLRRATSSAWQDVPP